MILDFPTKYDSSITYYGIGFFWTNNAGSANVTPPGGITGGYRTLMGMGF